MQTVQYAANNETDQAANNDGLLIHIDNGSIVAEPVGMPNLPTDGRRIVVPAVGSQADIHEGTPPRSDQAKKVNGSPLAKTVSQNAADEEEDERENDDEGEGEGKETDRLIK